MCCYTFSHCYDVDKHCSTSFHPLGNQPAPVSRLLRGGLTHIRQRDGRAISVHKLGGHVDDLHLALCRVGALQIHHGVDGLHDHSASDISQ